MKNTGEFWNSLCFDKRVYFIITREEAAVLKNQLYNLYIIVFLHQSCHNTFPIGAPEATLQQIRPKKISYVGFCFNELV